MNQPLSEDKEQLIRTKAYEIWQSNGAQYGDPNSDWYQAQQIVEKEHSKTTDIVEKPIETRRQTMSVDKFYEPLSTWQKTTLNYWPFGTTKAQENLIQDSFKFQSKLVQMYVDTQFSLWKNYFDVLNSYTSWFSKAQEKTVAAVTEQPKASSERKPTPKYSEVRAAENDSIRLYEEQLVAKKNRQQVGEVVLGKTVVAEAAFVSVPVEKERIIIKHKEPRELKQSVAFDETAFYQGEVTRMKVFEETAEISKEVFLADEVTITKEVESNLVTAEEILRREKLELYSEGNAIIEDRP
ncbi:MAG: DUF2382 domain-containing protein [Hydrococcus sp. Prado102]|jgi:uncharacterized protein (TIGR02271 family)|nr:DUF2382 domain-containing protein [Hydrococcus sp. Prado102]